MDNSQETMKLALEIRERDAYNLITLSAGGIGFTVFVTHNETFLLNQIPLGLAVLFWGICILCGLISTNKLNDLALMLGEAFQIIEERNLTSETKERDALNEEIKKATQEIVDYEKESKEVSRWQRISFFSGIVMFVVWHVWRMSMN